MASFEILETFFWKKTNLFSLLVWFGSNVPAVQFRPNHTRGASIPTLASTKANMTSQKKN